MLGTAPPGYYSGSSNRQMIRGLGSPGLQSQPTTPGSNRLSSMNQPFGAQAAGQGPNIGSMTPGSSSYLPPSSIPGGQNPSINMNQFAGSHNRSTLLRTLMGRNY